MESSVVLSSDFADGLIFGVLCSFGIAPGVDRRRGDSACVRQQIPLP